MCNADRRLHRSPVTMPARNASAMKNNVSADFCFRKSVCFQREKGKENQMEKNRRSSDQIGLNESVPLLLPTLLPSGVREAEGFIH